MPKFAGGCYCGAIRYEINCDEQDTRMSICHCQNCKKFTGAENGITAKVPKEAFTITKGQTRVHKADNGSGTDLIREFCPSCGSGIAEYGEPVKDQSRYVFYGSLDEPERLPPKGEFFCGQRARWMPEVSGVFHKEKIKE